MQNVVATPNLLQILIIELNRWVVRIDLCIVCDACVGIFVEFFVVRVLIVLV